MNHIHFYTQTVEEIPNKDWELFRNFEWVENLVTPTGVTTTLPIGTRVYLAFSPGPQLPEETARLLKTHFLLKKSEYYCWLVDEMKSVGNAAWNLFRAALELNFNFETQVLTQEDWQNCLTLTNANLNAIIGREVSSVWDRVDEESRHIFMSGTLWIPKAPVLTPAS